MRRSRTAMRTPDIAGAAPVWTSPEWCPTALDRTQRRIQFVRMSPDAYRASVFLNSRTRHLGQTLYLPNGTSTAVRGRFATRIRSGFVGHIGRSAAMARRPLGERIWDVTGHRD